MKKVFIPVVVIAIGFIFYFSSCSNIAGGSSNKGSSGSSNNSTDGVPTNYIVEHWQQNANNDNYTCVSSDTTTKTGVSGTLTEATANTYSDFNLKSPIEQKTISADGNTVVKVYYDRKTFTYTFDANGGHWNDGSTKKEYKYRYGQLHSDCEVITPDNPVKNGYSFNGWNPNVGYYSNGEETFTAQWNQE